MPTGKAIVSTPVRDVVKQWSDIVLVANNAEQFLDQAGRALARDQEVQRRVQRGTELANQSSWESTVAKMQSLIKEAISKPHRKSGEAIRPLAEDELEYVFMATQGS